MNLILLLEHKFCCITDHSLLRFWCFCSYKMLLKCSLIPWFYWLEFLLELCVVRCTEVNSSQFHMYFLISGTVWFVEPEQSWKMEIQFTA